MLSQNGWPVASSADIHYYQLVGGKVGLRKGAVATVLVALAGDLQKLERAVWPGIWGWYVRPIRGQSTGYSNHASGTAMDWNAPTHPRQSGSRYLGWSSSQVVAIHHLLTGKYAGVIRWGADYRTTPYDPMHFEINASPAAVARLAGELSRPAPPPVNHSSVYYNPIVTGADMFFIRETSSNAVFLCWPGYRQWMQNGDVHDAYVEVLNALHMPSGTRVIPDGTKAQYGAIVGPDHA